MPEKRQRLPRSSLSRDAIVRAALVVIDRDGAAGLTIRAVARELGADPAGLYRYFHDKAELFHEVGDRLLVDIHPPRPDATWREALEELADGIRSVLVRHRGGAELFGAMSYTPTATRLVEQTLAHLTAAGLPASIASDAFRATIALIFGHIATLGETNGEGFWPELLAAATPPTEFPTIHATATDWSNTPATQFRRELALLLAGIDQTR